MDWTQQPGKVAHLGAAVPPEAYSHCLLRKTGANNAAPATCMTMMTILVLWIASHEKKHNDTSEHFFNMDQKKKKPTGLSKTKMSRSLYIASHPDFLGKF